MKLSRVTTMLAIGVASLLLATTAFASNKGPLDLTDAVIVNGQALPAGSYQVKWEGSGPDVQLSIVQGKKVVATTAAHMVAVPTANNVDAVATRSNSDGSKSLTTIRPFGKKYALVVGNETQASTGETTTK